MSALTRNCSCPCGSGAKFKRCCLPRVERAARAQREHDRIGADMLAWACDEHGAILRRLLAPSWPDRWRLDGRLSEELFVTWTMGDADPGDGGPSLARRYAERADLAAQARDVARRIAAARLDVHCVRGVVPGVWLDLEPLEGGAVTRVMSPSVSKALAADALVLARVVAGPPAPSLWSPVRSFPPADERKWRARLRAHPVDSPAAAIELLRFDPADHAAPLPEDVELFSAGWRIEDDALACEDLELAPGVRELGLQIGAGDDAWAFAWLAPPNAGAIDLGGWEGDDGDPRIEAARIVVEAERLTVHASGRALLLEIGAWLTAHVEGVRPALARAA